MLTHFITKVQLTKTGIFNYKEILCIYILFKNCNKLYLLHLVHLVQFNSYPVTYPGKLFPCFIILRGFHLYIQNKCLILQKKIHISFVIDL